MRTKPTDGLMHELVHAYRSEVRVNLPREYLSSDGNPTDDNQTIGIEETDWKGYTPVTENILRSENHRAKRTRYNKPIGA